MVSSQVNWPPVIWSCVKLQLLHRDLMTLEIATVMSSIFALASMN